MKSKKGFTLIELLVVVLIIGILAAIAVPQYQVSVGKSKLATLKNITKSIVEAEEVYYLQNGHYANSFASLDVVKPENASCQIWAVTGEQNAVACSMTISDKSISYYMFMQNHPWNKTPLCFTSSSDLNSLVNRICKADTGNICGCNTASCWCGYD